MNPLAVVTGGTKGIGRATAELFLAKGFDVVTCARRASDLDEFRALAEVQFPDAHLHTFRADLSIRADTAAFVAFVNARRSTVSVLVNNTGTFIPGQLHKEPEGVLERSIETNVYSAYHVTRGLLPSMVERKSGHVFMICSTASLMAYPNGGSYSVSKFALHGMAKGLREELKPHGIKVTSVLPGATLTASWDGTDLPSERFMPPQDVAEAIWSAYAMSPATVVEEILMRPLPGDIE